MRILLAFIGRVCELLWPTPDLRYRIDDGADKLADLEAEYESTPYVRFGPAFEGEAGNSPGVVSERPPILPRSTAAEPTPGQPDYDLYMQALSIAGLLQYHSLLDPAAHQCHCLHKALSAHGHRKHLTDMVINMLDADHRISHKFQN